MHSFCFNTQKWLYFLFIALFFLPTSSRVGGVAFWYMILVLIGIVFLFIGRKIKFNKIFQLSIIIFLIFLGFTTISIICSYKYAIVDDVFELIRVVALFVFFFCGYFFVDKNIFKFLVVFFSFFLFFQFFISVLQKFEYIKNIFSYIWNMDKAWYLRSTGTLGNPNVLGLFSILSYSFIFYFSNSKALKIMLFIVFTINILLSGSRTGLICYFIFVSYILIFHGRVSISKVIKRMFFVLVFCSFFVSILYSVSDENKYLAEIFSIIDEGQIDLTKVSTFSRRIGTWGERIEFFSESDNYVLAFGVGPAKGLGFRVMDNDYLGLFIKYGIIGVLSYLILFLYILYVAKFSTRYHVNSLYFFFSIILIYLFYSITGATFLSIINMLPVMLLSGSFLGLSRKRYLNGKNINY